MVFGLVAMAQAQIDEGLNPLCAGVANNRFVAHPDDCQMYILCQNELALPARCPQPADATKPEIWFDPTTEVCRKEGAFCAAPVCRGKDRVFVADPNSECGGWIYCLGEEEGHNASCPYGLSFVPETQFCTYPLCASAAVPAAADRAAPHVLL